MTQPAKKLYQKNQTEQVSAEFFRNKLKLKSLEVRNNFNQKYPHVKKFFDDRGVDLINFRKHSGKVIATGALTGSLLLNPPTLSLNIPPVTQIIKNLADFNTTSSTIPNQQTLLESLQNILPQKIGPLDRSQEKTLEQVFRNTLGVNARATLEGEHLNTTYGYIGAEQHLMRYPGDTMATHPKLPEKDEGMAPGRGAWGYVPEENEKWYAVVQTLYLPDWSSRQPYLRDWYKFRKVLIVNTINGNAVIADIADSGPAAFTGKHFGGSPEVMNYLGGSRYKKGPVVIFFVDDPENKVPLGPVEYNTINNINITNV
ncbi:MAG TPA: hypothetical protein VL401_02205 [Alphaproteobacteria bacterium]|jgi:hypothetical protein|nr:hypothetical protein [Alphaproteobacteria bacterium]